MRVFIADDHEIVRDGIKRMLAEEKDIVICGEAGEGLAVIRLAREQSWDVLILDMNLPGANGLEIIKQIRTFKPDQKIVVFSMYEETSHAVRALRAGARGFVSKDRPPRELIDAIRKVHQGGRYVPPALAEYLFEHEVDLQKDQHQSLSDREYEVFLLIAKGKTPTEIAVELSLGASTVTTYVHRIKQKLAVRSIGEIVQYAYRHGLAE